MAHRIRRHFLWVGSRGPLILLSHIHIRTGSHRDNAVRPNTINKHADGKVSKGKGLQPGMSATAGTVQLLSEYAL